MLAENLNHVSFWFAEENESKECHLSDMKTKLKNDFHTLKSLGEKYEKLNSQYMKKSQEFAPQHIRVSMVAGNLQLNLKFS